MSLDNQRRQAFAGMAQQFQRQQMLNQQYYQQQLLNQQRNYQMNKSLQCTSRPIVDGSVTTSCY